MVAAVPWAHLFALAGAAIVDAWLLVCLAAFAAGVIRWGFRRRP